MAMAMAFIFRDNPAKASMSSLIHYKKYGNCTYCLDFVPDCNSWRQSHVKAQSDIYKKEEEEKKNI